MKIGIIDDERNEAECIKMFVEEQVKDFKVFSYDPDEFCKLITDMESQHPVSGDKGKIEKDRFDATETKD